MPEYLAPGVYVEEVDTGPKPIEGVSTSTVGFVGMTVRGSTTGPPKLVTSFSDFRRKFGAYLPQTLGDNRFLPLAVQGFFENGGKRLYVKRVLGTGASTAGDGGALVGGLVTRLTKNAVSGDTTVYLSTLRGIEAVDTSGPTARTNLTFTQVKDGVTHTESHGVETYDAATGAVTLMTSGGLTEDLDARYTTVETDISDPGTSLTISAADEGAWGEEISVQIYHTSLAQAEVVGLAESTAGSGDFDVVELSTTANFYAGAIVEFDKGETKLFGKVDRISGSSIVLSTALSAATDLDHDASGTTMARTCEFRIVASYDGVSEDFSPLTLDDTTDYYYQDVIDAASTLISVNDSADNATEDPFTMPSAPDGLTVPLTGGGDGTAPSHSDYVGVDNGPGQRTGIRALEDIDEISIIAVPGMTNQTIQNFMITHCETLKDRFAILDPTYNANSALSDIQTQRKRYDTKYAALYFPKLLVRDPVSGNGKTMTLPPSGHIAGIYARSDVERGVHKAPANEVVRGITGFDLLINKGEQDILNPSPNNINVLRDFRARGRGYRVWGARCITSDTSWKYVNVRRLFIFLEESLEEGTQWVVFEPNDEQLWARVRQSVSNFLTRVWRDGALMGTTPEEAFFVKCDRTTMTQDDIDNGKLIMLIGVAAVKPAEYVIIRIGQWAGGSEAQEL